MISFCSLSLNILYSIKCFFENTLNIKEYSFKEKTGSTQRKIIYYYYIFGKSAETIANYLYKDATIYLERKYSRYKNWKNSPVE